MVILPYITKGRYLVLKKNFSNYKKRANIMKAMAHPVRLLILDHLSKGEMCVCEINELVSLDQSTVSKHLAVLRNAGIVEDEKRGMKVFYTLKTPCVLKYLDCVEGVIRAN
ncbi:MAG: transcriptional regulator [Bdellovibrionales bacterium RIFOXYB1_FULL_37_110]|nr:MAG: transcriptional regulator [Bdellovibrionales bacterium RIFOXYC1_FULL_37_79]OFZ57320.1 MAG: transcriptional regulator [Bdellovibrionales bacterium RIFOXYB1_FULL_37_110]OFZ62216.1 MAG: transcriptional regulator [Bdellovibrionales bacterium RIFOXYD1_FULL_36_51]